MLPFGRGADRAQVFVLAVRQIEGFSNLADGGVALAEQLDERQLVELVFVVGTYTCLAMAFNSFGVQLEPGADAGSVPPRPSGATE